MRESDSWIDDAAWPRVHFRAIVVLAAALRLGIAALTLAVHSPEWFFSNAADLSYLAQSIASAHGLSSPFGGSTGPSALITPGYPGLIAAIFAIFGSKSAASAIAVIGAQILFAVLTVLVIMQIANRLFGAMTANIAGTLWAVSPPLLWMPMLFWDTCLSALLLIGALAFSLLLAERRGTNLWLLAGVTCGLTLLVNPALILAMIAMFGWAAFRARSVSSHKPMMGLLVMFMVFMPWPIRNVHVMHAPILLRSSFGYELWQGNRPGGKGAFDETLYPLHSRSEYAQYVSLGEVGYMREKSAKAEAYIRAHPYEFVCLTARRITRYWVGTQENENLLIVELYTVPTLVLGSLGLVLFLRGRNPAAAIFLLPILLYPLPYYITDVRFRYRMIIDPFMTILAAYAITQMTAFFRKRSRPVVAAEI